MSTYKSDAWISVTCFLGYLGITLACWFWKRIAKPDVTEFLTGKLESILLEFCPHQEVFIVLFYLFVFLKMLCWQHFQLLCWGLPNSPPKRLFAFALSSVDLSKHTPFLIPHPLQVWLMILLIRRPQMQLISGYTLEDNNVHVKQAVAMKAVAKWGAGLNVREWAPVKMEARGAWEERHSQSRNVSSAARRLFPPFWPHRDRGRRGRRWDLGRSLRCWTPGVLRWPVPVMTLQRSMNKQLYHWSPKHIHFWEGKKVLWTIRLDNGHIPKLFQMVSVRPQGKEETAYEPWWQTGKCWLNSTDLGKRET